MNHFINAFPLGNADTTLIRLNSGKLLLIDYANTYTGEKDDRRCDLPVELDKLVETDSYDVVIFTHADMDHVQGFASYFHLEHAEKYQGGDRKKINELWVPAQVILEEGCEDETRILRTEARHRLRNKKGIRVFSNPDKLKGWLEKEKVAFSDVEHLIVNAGTTVPGWGATNPELEIFAHAPFAYTFDANTEINRNDACIVLQATFNNLPKTKFLLLADADSELLHSIIDLSERFDNHHRLNWDIVHLPHHMSYLSLGPEKGKEKTEPVDPVRRLYEDYGQEKSLLISPSCPVPDSYDTIQPPHRQAYNYYASVADLKNGELQVTMEFPAEANPRPMEVTINNYGLTLVKAIVAGGFTTERKIPQAG